MKNRKRNRMVGFDYSSNNLYFVTICVQDRKCCFGYVGTLGTGSDLSVHSDDPNHTDDLNRIDDPKQSMNLNEYGSIAEKQWQWLANQYAYVILHSFVIMPNHVHAILEIDSNLVSESGAKVKSVSELLGAYKTTSSKQIHLAGFLDFSWQRSFHDHIIRNGFSYARISNYIETNPERWITDTFFDS